MAGSSLEHEPATNAVDLVRNLDPDDIKQRIDAIDKERDALLVLMRAALRAKPRGRVIAKSPAPPSEAN